MQNEKSLDEMQDLDLPMEEIDEMIAEGVKAHNEITMVISQNISDLANTAHTIGRYQELKRQKQLMLDSEDETVH